MSASDTVLLKGMRFHTRVGVLPHEAELPQPVEVDVAVSAARTGPSGMAATGAPSTVLDYVSLHAAVADVMSAPHIRYLEDAAERIAAAVLRLPGVAIATVSVRKPHVPLPGPVEYAQVTITRGQDG